MNNLPECDYDGGDCLSPKTTTSPFHNHYPHYQYKTTTKTAVKTSKEPMVVYFAKMAQSRNLHIDGFVIGTISAK